MLLCELVSTIPVEKLPLRYWFNPTTKDVRNLTSKNPMLEHGGDVLNHPEVFGIEVGQVRPIDIDGGFLRKMVRLALDAGWVRVVRMKPDTSMYAMQGSDRGILVAARYFDANVHPISRLVLDGTVLGGDDLQRFLRFGTVRKAA